jgi:hypothetical protein
VNEKLFAGETPPSFETLPESNMPLNSVDVNAQLDMTSLGRVVAAFALGVKDTRARAVSRQQAPFRGSTQLSIFKASSLEGHRRQPHVATES